MVQGRAERRPYSVEGKTMDYIAIIHKEAKGAYGVSFPDFPGCITAGETLDQAKDRAAEALAFHMEGMIEDGDPLPEPSGLDKIMADRGFKAIGE